MNDVEIRRKIILNIKNQINNSLIILRDMDVINQKGLVEVNECLETEIGLKAEKDFKNHIKEPMAAKEPLNKEYSGIKMEGDE